MRNHDIERKVRALLDRSNHPGTPLAEAEAALAMAYRLMIKYEIPVLAISGRDSANGQSARESDSVMTQRRYETTGPYRVRRYSLRYGIAEALSCAMFRATNEEDTDTVVCRAFGAASDLDAAETLYAAAEMLALRMIPWGDRGYRTAWWHGFSEGLAEKLRKERRKVERRERGAALVLRERQERAKEAMIDFEPHLVWRSRGSVSSSDAFDEGRRAGSRFSSGTRGVSGSARELSSGK